jgi:hypothetical protein
MDTLSTSTPRPAEQLGEKNTRALRFFNKALERKPVILPIIIEI